MRFVRSWGHVVPFATFALAACLPDGFPPPFDPPPGGAVITGRAAGAGVVCPQFRLESGETVSLSGAVPVLAPGMQVTLAGQWMSLSRCMQGREFRVTGAV